MLFRSVKICGAGIGEVTVATSNADGSMRDLSDILADCRVAFAGLSESEKAAAAEALVGKNGGQPEKQEEPEEKLPEIDFEGLRAINGDVVAWIQIPGIGVDYPVVQGKDNEHYLHYTFDGKTNKEGSIFLDYRNRADFTDSKVIIYGHNMKDGSMFSNLKKFQDAGFRKEQGRVLLYLPDRVLEYEIVECRKVSVRDSVYEVASEEDRDVLEKVILSTCSVSANNRLIVICKIKPYSFYFGLGTIFLIMGKVYI